MREHFKAQAFISNQLFDKEVVKSKALKAFYSMGEYPILDRSEDKEMSCGHRERWLLSRGDPASSIGLDPGLEVGGGGGGDAVPSPSPLSQGRRTLAELYFHTPTAGAVTC